MSGHTAFCAYLIGQRAQKHQYALCSTLQYLSKEMSQCHVDTARVGSGMHSLACRLWMVHPGLPCRGQCRYEARVRVTVKPSWQKPPRDASKSLRPPDRSSSSYVLCLSVLACHAADSFKSGGH